MVGGRGKKEGRLSKGQGLAKEGPGQLEEKAGLRRR